MRDASDCDRMELKTGSESATRKQLSLEQPRKRAGGILSFRMMNPRNSPDAA
ncbi:hypothetical protein [Sphingobium sp. SYK-6]|uniref:hypothetical protein n=1 Tax=Sphingobium sp. (strain NBRC 103272 / SYK-6) TaxID=627192 RepID=UPI001E47098F|nr:hypothetical protein [Sphingobium sp. SYK-6]